MELFTGNLTLILCGLIGFGLLMLEAFMPGFGVAGISGIVLEIIAVYSAWASHGPVFALILTAVIILVVGFAVFLSYRSAMKGRLSRSNLILKDEEKESGEAAAASLLKYQDQEGVAVSALRPGGTVEIGGVRVNAHSSGDLIPRGAKVRVTGAEGDHVTVRPV